MKKATYFAQTGEGTHTMDVIRERPRTNKSLLVLLTCAAILGLGAWLFTALSRSNSIPSVDRATLVTDTARRGVLVLTVNAQGVFAPEHVQIVSAAQSGVVNQIFIKAGSVVVPGMVVAQMENPALTAAAADARAALQAALATLSSARQEARATVITQQTREADAQAGHSQDTLQAKSLASLHAQGLIADIQYRTAQIEAEKSANDLRASRAQVDVASAESAAKIAAAQAQVDQAAAQLAADEAQIGALTIRAQTTGIAQSVDVDPGASLSQGAQVARIADLRSLKAVLQVPEDDAHAIVLGMPVRVSGYGNVRGRISHIAPSAQNGTVAVDVSFPGDTPAGARPDATVDGTITVASMPNAVSIARPAGATNFSSIDMFRILDGGARAVRIHAKLGSGSYDRVQVLSGVEPGDTVVVSDMSPYIDKAELRLH